MEQEGDNHWKPLALALISVVVTVVLAVVGMTRGAATIEQLKEDRIVSRQERDDLRQSIKDLYGHMYMIRPELPRREQRAAPRLDYLEQAVNELQKAQATLAVMRVEMRALQEEYNRVQAFLHDGTGQPACPGPGGEELR